MKTKTELEKEILELKERLLRIEDDLRAVPEGKKWVPELEEEYWFIDSCGVVFSMDFPSTATTTHHRRTDNCYQTEDLATTALELKNLNIEIREALEKANDGWVADYTNADQDKYCIAYYKHGEPLKLWMVSVLQYNKYPAKSTIILENLIDKYGNESVCRAFGVIE